MRFAPAVSCLALALLAAGPLEAQIARESLWFAAGAGYGTAATDCDDCTANRESGYGFHFRFGGTSSPHATLGAEAALWQRSDEGSKIDIKSLLGIIQMYPSTTAGLYFDFGVGFSHTHLEFPAIEYQRTAIAVQLGAGYDIAISRHLAITPAAFYIKSLGGGNTEFNGSDIDEVINPDYFQLGIGLSWH